MINDFELSHKVRRANSTYFCQVLISYFFIKMGINVSFGADKIFLNVLGKLCLGKSFFKLQQRKEHMVDFPGWIVGFIHHKMLL